MMDLNLSAVCMSMALHFVIPSMLLCSMLVWVERQDNKKQRSYLAVTLIIGSMMMLLRLLLTYKDGIPLSYPVLPIQNLYGGFWALLLLFFYPVEAVNPGWMRMKTLVMLFIPMISVSVVLLIFPLEFRNLYSLNDVMLYIREPNVWLRAVMLFVFIIPYSILLLFVPYNWQISSVDVKWIRFYSIGVQGIAILFIAFMLTGSLVVSAIHLTYCSLFFIYITYQELFLRLFPIQVEASSSVDSVCHKNILDQISIQENSRVGTSQLWERFEEYTANTEPWRSPDITLTEVAYAIGSNRTTLSAEIHSRGYATFHDLVASYRIKAFCDMVLSGDVDNVNEAFFSVGFRSRTSAYARFKEAMNRTPAEYIKNIKREIR